MGEPRRVASRRCSVNGPLVLKVEIAVNWRIVLSAYRSREIIILLFYVPRFKKSLLCSFLSNLLLNDLFLCSSFSNLLLNELFLCSSLSHIH